MYSRHKDASPQDTIRRIRGILQELNLDPDVKLLQNTGGLCSAILEDREHGWQVNGKGTTEEYCLASAYGEAMERLQAYYFYDRLEEGEPETEDRFLLSPDERLMETRHYRQAFPAIAKALTEVYALDQGVSADSVSEKDLDDFVCRFFSDTTVTLPYCSVWENKVVYLPEHMISALCGSNGLCAGNTPFEALNQGIAEILERHVKDVIFRNGYTPPEIPRDYIRKYAPALYEIIREVEKSGPYTIVIKDASLGVGMPVACALFVDREHQRYHAKFGSSFSLIVAMERCLTELFQGFDLKDSRYHQRIMTRWNVELSVNWNDPVNRRLQLRTDMGSVPVSYISGTPTWEFRDWETTEGYGRANMDNGTALRFMLQKLKVFYPQVYIRDFGFLGFPAYRIYVPGVSDIYLPMGPRCRYYRICKSAMEKLYRVPAVRLSEEELTQCYDYLTGEDNVYRDNFGNVPLEVVRAVFYYVFGETEKAISSLHIAQTQPGSGRYACAAMELELAQLGIPEEARNETLSLFFEPGDVAYARRAFRMSPGQKNPAVQIDRVIDPAGRKLFAVPGNGIPPGKREMHARMRRKLQEHCPDQQKLLQTIGVKS